jgi:hypothetical protein
MQECILFPTLFSILMKDLSDMLEKENTGVSLSSKIINALTYADDVALIAESESDLRKMLKIFHDFACKWNLKFNHSKSKVLVVGQRIVRDSSVVRRHYILLLEPSNVRAQYIRKTADLLLQHWVSTFPRFVAIGFYFLSETLI